MPAVISLVVLEMLHWSTRKGSLALVAASCGASGHERSIAMCPVRYSGTKRSPPPGVARQLPSAFRMRTYTSSASCCAYPPPPSAISANCGATLRRTVRKSNGGKAAGALFSSRNKSRSEAVRPASPSLALALPAYASSADCSSGMQRSTCSVEFR